MLNEPKIFDISTTVSQQDDLQSASISITYFSREVRLQNQ